MQRAYPPRPGIRGPGAVYEVTGPFRQPSGAPAAVVYGPPAGERRGGGPLGRPQIRLTTRVRRRLGRALFLRRGVTLTLSANERLRATVTLDSARAGDAPGSGGSARRPKTVALARARRDLAHDEQATRRLRRARALAG